MASNRLRKTTVDSALDSYMAVYIFLVLPVPMVWMPVLLPWSRFIQPGVFPLPMIFLPPSSVRPCHLWWFIWPGVRFVCVKDGNFRLTTYGLEKPGVRDVFGCLPFWNQLSIQSEIRCRPTCYFNGVHFWPLSHGEDIELFHVLKIPLLVSCILTFQVTNASNTR